MDDRVSTWRSVRLARICCATWTIVLLSVLMVSLTSCGGKNANDTEMPAVTFNCPANALQIKALEEEIPAFTEKTGIEVKLNPFSGEEKLYAMLAADQAPDIFYTNTVVRDKLAAEGYLLDLNSVGRGDPFLSRLRPAVIERGTSIDGGWYSISNWEFTCGVYYNRDLFDKYGIRYPDSMWTWDEMVETAKRLTADSDGDGRINRYGIFIGSHFVEAFELMNHAPIHPNTILLDIAPESQEVYRKYLGLMAENIMPDLRRVQAMGMQAQQLLENGRVAMLVEAVPNSNLLEYLTINVGLAPLPRFDNKEPLYFRSGSGGLSIYAGTKHPRAAWQVLKWLISEAGIYQPSPVLNDVDFVGGWFKKYPRLKGSGFETVWKLSERYNGGDPRYFVRFSSWTSHAILEQFQPLLDQLWGRSISLDDLLSRVPEINRHVLDELEDLLRSGNLKPAFSRALRKEYERAKEEMANLAGTHR